MSGYLFSKKNAPEALQLVSQKSKILWTKFGQKMTILWPIFYFPKEKVRLNLEKWHSVEEIQYFFILSKKHASKLWPHVEIVLDR